MRDFVQWKVGAPDEWRVKVHSLRSPFTCLSHPLPSHQFNPFIESGFLSLQFMVDAACKVLQNRLDWARTHQREIRTEMLEEVQATFWKLQTIETGQTMTGT